MSQTARDQIPASSLRLGALFSLELVALVLLFQVLSAVECRETTVETACRALRGGVLRGMCLGLGLGVYLWARGGARTDFARIAAMRPPGRLWPVRHAAGVVLMVLPVLTIPAPQMNAQFHLTLPVLAMGAALAAAGGLFWLARPADWAWWLRDRRAELLALTGLALLLPDLVDLLTPLWHWQVLTAITFLAVAVLLSLFSDALVADPQAYVIGADGFLVRVAQSCSGIEGVVLITAFLALFALLFHDTLRQRRFWLVVWPVALLLSWLFNVIRIAALVLIGIHASPDLAVNGFHSFAGWLFFAVLAIGILVWVSRSAWLMRNVAARAPLGLRDDPVALCLVPFIVFMLSGVVVQTFWLQPDPGYPLRVAVVAAALWWMRRPLAAHLARPGAAAVLAGLGVGAGWVLLAPAPVSGPQGVTTLTGWALAGWVAARLAGTVILVPIVEEMFFRGYVQARLDRGTWATRALAIAVPAILFAALHGRWLEAGLASVIFSLVFLRKGRLADAIIAHAAANAVVAFAALVSGHWSLI